MTFVSTDGICDECGHAAEAHDLHARLDVGQPCTIDGCECADYYNHIESMVSLADHLATSD